MTFGNVKSKIVFLFISSLLISFQLQGSLHKRLEELAESVRNGKEYELALDIALRSLKSDTYHDRQATLEVFNALFDRNIGFQQAFTAIEAICHHKSSRDLKVPGKLLGEIVCRGSIAGALELVKEATLVNPKKGSIGVEAFEVIIPKGYGYLEATQVAQELFLIDTRDAREVATDFLVKLIAAGEAHEIAFEKAKSDFELLGIYQNKGGRRILCALVEQGVRIPEALRYVEIALRDKSSFISNDWSELLIKLAQKGEGYAQAFEITQWASQGGRSVASVKNLLFQLVREGQYCPEILEKAVELTESGERYQMDLGISLLNELVKNGRGVAEAYGIVRYVLETGEKNYSGSEENLAISLFSRGFYVEEFGEFFSCKMRNKGFQSLSSSEKGLLQILLQKGECIDATAEVAQVMLASSSWKDRGRGTDLFKSLVRNKQCYKEAIIAAQQAVADEDEDVCEAGLELFLLLVQHKQGKNEARGSIESLINSESEMDQSMKDLVSQIQNEL